MHHNGILIIVITSELQEMEFTPPLVFREPIVLSYNCISMSSLFRKKKYEKCEKLMTSVEVKLESESLIYFFISS